MRLKIAIFVINIITLLLLAATVASGQTTNYIDAKVHITGIATAYLDRVETSLKYAQQLRDLGYLGASIDILIEAVDELRERDLRDPTVQVVTVTQSCQRTHCDDGCPSMTAGKHSHTPNGRRLLVPACDCGATWFDGQWGGGIVTNINANVEAP